MIYLLFGTQGLILEKQCKKILKENLESIDDFHLQKVYCQMKFVYNDIYLFCLIFQQQYLLCGKN